MKRQLDRLSRLAASLRGAALAALAATAATIGVADTASAQAPRPERTSVWQETARNGRVIDRRAPDVRVPRNEFSRSLGRYETRYERVWVPGRSERRWCPPQFEWRYDSCGRRIRVQVRAGYWGTIQHPGFYERRAVRVWVPARPVCEPVRDRRGTRSRRHRVSKVGRRFR